MADNILNYLIKATWQGGEAARKARTDIKGVGEVGVTARNGLLELQAGLDIAKQALGGAQQVVEQFYGALKEGADLELARSKFDALAGSIGATGDALLNDLGAATGGMVSNSKLIQASTDLMNLGLVSTADETVRWSRAVSTLNLDMQVLGLTLANNSKARLDSLGLSMQTVNEKTAKFVALGNDADQAFDMAVLEGLEEKMALFGEASETTAGKLQIIENKWTNLTDKIKLDLAEAWIPWIDLLSGEFANTVREIEQSNLEAAQATDDWTKAKYRTVEAENEIIAAAARSSAGVDEFTRKLTEAGVHMFDERTTRMWYDQERAIWEAAGTMEQYNEQMDRQARLTQTVAVDTSYLAQTVATWGYVQEEAYAGMSSDSALLEDHAATVAAARGEYELYTSIISGYATIVADGYGAAALASEDSQARQEAANLAISASYRAASLAVFESRLAETVQEDGLAAAQGLIAYQEALGLITPEEAAKLGEVAVKTEAINTATGALFDVYMSDGVLTREEMDLMAEAVRSIEEGTLLMSDAIIQSADADMPKIVGLHQETATLDEKLGNAASSAGTLSENLGGLPKRIDVDIYVNTHGTVPDLSGGVGGSAPQPRATGGPVAAGQPYVVGERGPELFVPAGNGRIVPNAAMMGDTMNFYISSSDPRQAADEVSVILARRARLNKAARV